VSANIYWTPVNHKHINIPTWSPSSYKATLERAFGSFPLILGNNSIPIIAGIAAAQEDKRQGDCFMELVEAIERHGEIMLEVEY